MSKIFGGICQVGYVVSDIETAMQKWLDIGVGPWFYREASPISEFKYRGKPSAFPEMSIALANSGDMQIELIQQRNGAPSLYKEFLDAGMEGVQHVAYWTDDKFDEWSAYLLAHGFAEGHAGRIGTQGRFAYFVSKAIPGTVIELSETAGNKGERFRTIRAAAREWDGTEPIRRVALPKA
jgi:hypothetical protein